MRAKIGSALLELVQGDITQQAVDAIVNAANSALAGGGGVDGAIHRVGGPTLMDETDARYPNGCPTGDAVPTSAGDLPAKFVLHAVGPIWRGGRQGEPALLADVHRRCLGLARELECASIAFPALSTGAFGYPLDAAAETAIGTVRDELLEHDGPAVVRFVLFDQGAYGQFARVLEGMTE